MCTIFGQRALPEPRLWRKTPKMADISSGKPFAMAALSSTEVTATMVSLSDIHGLWRRHLIAWPNGETGTTRVLMRGFALALGEAPDFFDRYLTKPPSQLRLIHYPHNPAAGEAIGHWLGL